MKMLRLVSLPAPLVSLTVLAVVTGVFAQNIAPATAPAQPSATEAAPPPSSSPKRGAAELEKLAMPIALYPDPLISLILPASVYPVEIVQAARFVKDTNNIPKVKDQPWDENVKAVAEIPEVISKLDADLAWTVELGQAFLDQPKELMDTIQDLRAKAQKAGNLRTTPQQVVTVTNVVVVQTNVTQVVTVTNQIIQVQSANPQVVYVPTYPPTVYYPPPGYVYNPYAPLVTFGVGIAVGAIIANNCDWHHGGVYVGHYHGDVDVDINRNVNVNNVNVNRGSGNTVRNTPAQTGQKWQPNQERLRTSGAPPSAQTREARGWGSPSTQPAQRSATGSSAARPSQMPSTGAGASRPAQQPSYNWSQNPSPGTQPARTPGSSAGASPSQRPSTAQQPTRTGASPSAGARPAQTPSVSRPSQPSPSAFNSAGSSGARASSSRGAASRGGGGMSRGGGGGRGR